MLVLGIILIVVGAAIGYFFRPDRFAEFAAAILVIVGVVLVIIGAVNTTGSHVDTSSSGANALRASYGTGLVRSHAGIAVRRSHRL
jgi:putative Mn2+ efflux pump MntP